MLNNIKNMHINESDKLKIILQLLLTIRFLQMKKYIYRDLSPNNLIIDQNNNLYLIDFNKMIYKAK